MLVGVPSFTDIAVFGMQMKTLGTNMRAELRPADRIYGVAIHVLLNITTYLLSLEARHTLGAEGEDKRVTKCMSVGAVKPWIDRCKGQPRPSIEGAHSGCIMPENHMLVLKTRFSEEGVRLDT